MAIPEILQYLLQYLIAHPDAKDTLQGILRWWFPGNMDREETEVQEALDLLVARSWLTQRRTIPSRTLYGLNKKKLEEIKVFLREREREADGHRE
jgi:hypothetical protein